jgi:hypothetical protein
MYTVHGSKNITEMYFLIRNTLLPYYIKNRPQLKPQAAACFEVSLASHVCNRAHVPAAVAPPGDGQLPPNLLGRSAEPESRLQNTGVTRGMNVIGIRVSVHTTRIASVESCKGEIMIQGTAGRSPSEKSGKRIY